MSASNLPAICDTCSKEFRVPDATKVYGCDECDGQVHALACPHCFESIAVDDAFCGSCGEELRVAAEPGIEQQETTPRVRVASRPGRGARGRKGAERSKASKELVKTLRNIKTVRAFFILDAFFHSLGLALVLFLVGQLQSDVAPLTATAAVRIAAIAVMVLGARMIFFRPFMWTVLMACLVTLSQAYAMIASGFSTFYVAFGVIWSLAFWSFVPAASRARRLIADNPDMNIARQFTGVSRGDEETDYQEEHEQAERSAWKKSLSISMVIAITLTLVSTFVISTTSAPDFQSAWDDFKEDWNSGDVEKVVAWFPSGARSGELERLQALRENRGWQVDWPQAEDELVDPSHGDAFVTELEDRRPSVYSDFEQGEIVWTFKAIDEEWALISVRFGLTNDDWVVKAVKTPR